MERDISGEIHKSACLSCAEKLLIMNFEIGSPLSLPFGIHAYQTWAAM